MQFLANTVGGQGVGASVLRLTSRATVRVRCFCFVNAGWALAVCGNREWSLRPDYPNPLPHSRVGVPKCNNQSVGFDGLLLARGVGGIRNECKQNGRTKPAVGTPRKSAYLPSSLKTSRAAETVSAMSCAVCAALTNPASYSAGAMYTPRSSRPWNRVLKVGPSVVMTFA
ncbi:hypothetical protein Y695_01013 [Hydrogenophaga sp. T4]|nr:hypothetical protein Y695_01013 [Hydrogenophaga sp. T4]